MAREDIIFKMGMDASDFNKGLQTANVEAKRSAKAMADLESAIKQRQFERLSVAEKINALRKEELELANKAFALAGAGDNKGSAEASLAALNLRTQREKLVTQEKEKQVALEKQLAVETKRVADLAAKQAGQEAKLRADLSERVRMEKQVAQLRHAPAAKSGGEGIMGGLGSAAAWLGLTVGVSSFFHWLGRVSERMTGLRRQAEDLGASMAFMAGLSTLERNFDAPAGSAANAMQRLVETIGAARDGSAEAQAKFARLGISLYDANGFAKNGEAVFKEVSDRIAGASDASQRAAISFSIFGKAGRDVNNILGMGGEKLDAFIAAQGRSEAMLQAQAKNWEQIRTGIKGAAEGAGDLTSKLALGLRAALAFGKGFVTGDVRGQLDAMRKSLRPEAQDSGTRTGDTFESEEDAIDRLNRNAVEAAKIQREIAEVRADDEQKIALLDEDMIKSLRELHSLQDGSVERRKKELEFTKQQHEWEKLTKKIVEEKAKAQEDAAKAQKKQAEDMLAAVNAAQNRQRELEGKRGEAETMRGDRTKFTLAELAGANLRGIRDPKLRADILKAREVQRLEAQAGRILNTGDQAGAEAVFSKADTLRSGIESLKSTERLTDIFKATTTVADEIKKFNATAEGQGFKVQPVFGK